MNSNKLQKPQLNILAVIALFIPIIGIIWLPNNRYAKLFVMYHFFTSGVIAIILMLYYLNVL
jgi:hypothetical protein